MAELAAAGKPSLLVPFAAATDDHQRKNAEAFVHANAAKMLLESELGAQRLLETLHALLRDPDSLARMSAQARALAHAPAVQTIAQMVDSLAPANTTQQPGARD
jgi:UDP-N-acetylglucosamine--N-acetylmuramyl-(pentapeptide) pyrophosphoryl-undecaprenol N-acetylglucosamine transferase